jgi:hypothetical protein
MVHADIYGKFGSERTALNEDLKLQPASRKRNLDFVVEETVERKKQAFDDSTALFFTNAMLSFNIIEHPSFLKMIETARASRSKLMSRRQLMRHIKVKVDESLAGIKKTLEKIYSDAITVDIHGIVDRRSIFIFPDRILFKWIGITILPNTVLDLFLFFTFALFALTFCKDL